MDKWFKDILPDKDPYDIQCIYNHDRFGHCKYTDTDTIITGQEGPNEEKGGSGIRVPVDKLHLLVYLV